MADVRTSSHSDKGQIRRNGIAMISDGYAVDSMMKMKTGGSTGKALELYMTEECSERRNMRQAA